MTGPKRGAIATAPRIAFHQALAKFVITPSGVTTVEDCSAREMRALVNAWARSAEDVKACKAALKEMDYSQEIDKWYSLDTLLNHSCHLELYDTAEVAQREQVKRAQAD